MSCSPPTWSFLNYVDENKLFTCITSFTFFVIGIFIYILNSYTIFEKRKIPRAVRPSAPFGNIKEVIFQDTTLYIFLWKYYNKFKRKKCKIGGFFLFFRPGILLVDPVFSNKICSNETDLEDLYPSGTLTLCKKILDISEEPVTKDFVKEFDDVEKNFLTILTERCNSFSDELYKYLLDSSCLIFGIENSPLLTKLLNIRKQKYTSNFSNFFKMFYPYFSTQASSYKYFKHIIENTIKIRKKTDMKTTNVLKKIIDVLTENKDIDSKEIYKDLYEIFMDNIVHSHSSILWCLYEISQNSEVQEELLGEIRRYNKENETLNLQNIEELSFLDALVKETFRKYPPVPTVIKKCKNEFSTEFGFKLPKNTLMFLSVFGIQHDPLNYPNPEHFDPDRFFEHKLRPDSYVPFGYGLQTDIGLHFTGIHIKLFLLSVFSKFRVRLEKDYTMEFDPTKLNVHPKEPLPLVFEAL